MYDSVIETHSTDESGNDDGDGNDEVHGDGDGTAADEDDTIDGVDDAAGGGEDEEALARSSTTTRSNSLHHHHHHHHHHQEAPAMTVGIVDPPVVPLLQSLPPHSKSTVAKTREAPTNNNKWTDYSTLVVVGASPRTLEGKLMDA